MTTPGFTAEASLSRASGQYRQVRLVPAAAAELLGLAQLGLPVLPSPVQRVRPVPLNGLEVYGNWCGPGHFGHGAPWDPVDQVCCRHDKCYDDRGILDCSCDRDLVARMPAAIADSRTSAAGRVAGTAAIALFSVSPCFCHKICVPLFGCRDIPGPVGVPSLPGLKICPPGTA